MSDAINIGESEEMLDCYEVLREFYECWLVCDARERLFKYFQAAMDKKATRSNPADVLFFNKKLVELLMAAIRIQKSGYQRKAAILDQGEKEEPDLSNLKDYCGWPPQYSAWSFAPRALSEKEYYNPYKAFKKLDRFATREEWRGILGEMQDFTFSRCSYAEFAFKYNMVRVHNLLQKLIEAAHLISVRAITEVEGRQARKRKRIEGLKKHE